MNWIAWDPRSYGGALLGGLVGFLAFGSGLEHGWSMPWLVGLLMGLLMGLGCALVTHERSTMRGIVLAIGAAWMSALAQVYYDPPAGTEGVLAGLMQFHTTLSGQALLGHLGSMLAAFLLGRCSFRRDAQRRLAGA